MVDEGWVLATGRPVLRLLEKASPEARIGVAGRAEEAVKIGQFHRVSVHGMPMTAKVKAVLPARNAEMRTVDVILTLAGDPTEVRIGDLVRLTLRRTVSESGFWLPMDALTEGNRESLVHLHSPIPRRSGIRRRSGRYPPPGSAHGRDSARGVRSGVLRGTLRDGDLLVTDGLHRVVPGQLMRVDDPSNFTTASWKA